jgi:hypothetical protein
MARPGLIWGSDRASHAFSFSHGNKLVDGPDNKRTMTKKEQE